jgi:HD-GYP domain-containing protein (c-di-GMP phosphodiesterase class II)
MSDTKSLLNRITAFRERLERTPSLVLDSTTSDPSVLVQRAARQALQPGWTSSALRQIAGERTTEVLMPSQLVTRARRLLETARELVGTQREVSDDVFFVRLGSQTSAGDADPLVLYHQHTVAATETTLRLAQSMPSAAEQQIRLCDGLETMLSAIQDRLEITTRSLEVRRREWGRVERLTRLLCDIQARRLVSFASFTEMAEELLDEARQGVPLRFIAAAPEPVARFVAAHALTVAQVMARVAPHDFEWAGQAVAAVATALIMDVGMLTVSAGTIGKSGPLDANDLGAIECHPEYGAKLLRELMPEIGPLADAVAAHHERLDGTGYPKATPSDDLPSLARLLAVCDVYAAMATDRPYRAAHDPRVALTDTLVMAEQGLLDRDLSEHLLRLSFHPVGTVVELTDGRTAVVVSIHTGRVNLRATTRPVVAVLADADGKAIPRPEFIDLTGSQYGGVVRALNTAERRRVLGATHPDLCC